MGKYDKDRFQKELAIRYCLARKIVPFLEVIVSNASDLSDSTEVLTDLDVVGVEALGDGGLRKTIFDCKTTNKMSSINRAFWAAGVLEYTHCDEAYVILKSKAVHNHRISALSINVDLHDEKSFKDLGLTIDAAFAADNSYQASIERWNTVYDAYDKNRWAEELYGLSRNIVPLTQTPWSIFRQIIAELTRSKGSFDPNKKEHLSIFFDILSSSFVLWAIMGRDIRRFYEPAMDKETFEKILSYYFWGGRESYNIRQQLRKYSNQEENTRVELPAWKSLVDFSGLIIAAPQSILECAYLCRELSIKMVCEPNQDFDEKLSVFLKENSRVRQFTVSLGDYLVEAAKIPKDLAQKIQNVIFDL